MRKRGGEFSDGSADGTLHRDPAHAARVCPGRPLDVLNPIPPASNHKRVVG